jgi:GH25 family lysozyme M1 (1,4-beta-N-acetylmuramidase)
MITITDISFWQSFANFQTMKAAGANGTILRAGQGAWKDTKFDEFRAGVRPILPFGSYWYYDNRYAPTTQADLYASILGSDPGSMGAWLDLEDGQTGAYGTWQHWQAFIERFKQKQPNVRLGIYTRASYIDSRIPSAQHTYFKQFDLWVAHYGVTTPSIPKAWSTWLFHQYTSTCDGKTYGVGSASIDLNRYNGTIEEFEKLFGGVTTPPEEKKYMYEITPNFTEGMKIRPLPNVNNTSIGSLAYGKTGKGDELWTAPADGTNVKKGDMWLKITEGGTAQGWVAVVHMGKSYCALKEITPNPDPDPDPEPTPAPEVAVTVDTKLLTVTIHSDVDMTVYFNGQKLK